ncbi:MAG: LysR family transcriptional regulator [Caulobacteraceae bacterium]
METDKRMDRLSRQRAAAISFRQLLIFESVTRLQSVQRAAEERHLSQPAMSQALSQLERHVGAPLLSRARNGSYLNPCGELFHRRVLRFFAQVEQALAEVGVSRGGSAVSAIVTRITRSQIRGLIAILDCGCLARAASSLGLSEAALQRASRDLECSLRAAIFHRSASGVSLTLSGEGLARGLKLAVQEIECGIQEVEHFRGQQDTQIMVGAMSFGGSMLLASTLKAFSLTHPNVHVSVVSETSATLQSTLRAGDLDMIVGLLPQTSDEHFVQEPLLSTPYRVVARLHHPIRRRGVVTLDDLMAYDWVVGTPGSNRREVLDRLVAHRRFPHATIATCSVPFVRQLLTDSDRLTLMTAYELKHEEGHLGAVPFDTIAVVPALGVMSRAGWLPTPLHMDFLDAIRQQALSASNVSPLRRER